MTIRDAKGCMEDRIPVNNVLVSVFDKTGLDTFVLGLFDINPNVRFMSTGGTYTAIAGYLGDAAKDHLIQVSDYTEFPEMEGGLVKTLHPKLHAGILGERNNPAHQEYLKNLGKTVNFIGEQLSSGCVIGTDVTRVFDAPVDNTYVVSIAENMPAVYIDMVVGNLYPFDKVTADPNVPFEKARGNIDIGGPTMIRGAAKNFASCAVVCDPADYAAVLGGIRTNEGCTTFEQRALLVPKVFEMTGKYDTMIAQYMAEQMKDPAKVKAGYQFTGGN